MRRVILAVVSTVVGLVLLLTFKTHSTSGGGSAPPAAISAPSGGAAGGVASAPASGGSTAGARTVTGAAVSTTYGPVQVQIMVKGGHVTAAKAVQYPQTFQQDQQINAYAIPELNREAVTAGSAKIDMVSGATYTSQGYISSLQSALDQAKIGA
ncbi:MAG TPA: FMN-binding protein [Streptosporangiaceae bacterium]|jgi:uncharacterized protein with FMN-binding domain|nr:FMN-binding protein [Streptosporangiaceae bacterium]